MSNLLLCHFLCGHRMFCVFDCLEWSREIGITALSFYSDFCARRPFDTRDRCWPSIRGWHVDSLIFVGNVNLNCITKLVANNQSMLVNSRGRCRVNSSCSANIGNSVTNIDDGASGESQDELSAVKAKLKDSQSGKYNAQVRLAIVEDLKLILRDETCASIHEENPCDIWAIADLNVDIDVCHSWVSANEALASLGAHECMMLRSTAFVTMCCPTQVQLFHYACQVRARTKWNTGQCQIVHRVIARLWCMHRYQQFKSLAVRVGVVPVPWKPALQLSGFAEQLWR